MQSYKRDPCRDLFHCAMIKKSIGTSDHSIITIACRLRGFHVQTKNFLQWKVLHYYWIDFDCRVSIILSSLLIGNTPLSLTG